MIKEDHLPIVFDILFGPRANCENDAPNAKSIKKINNHLGVELPNSFINFCSQSKCYGEWFCSIGKNYQDWNHIIRTNSYYKNVKRRYSAKSIYKNIRNSPSKKWTNIKPKHFIVIRWGHDDHCLILNTSKLTGAHEYELQYWDPGYHEEFHDAYRDFPAYIRSLVEYTYMHADKDIRILCDRHVS